MEDSKLYWFERLNDNEKHFFAIIVTELILGSDGKWINMLFTSLLQRKNGFPLKLGVYKMISFDNLRLLNLRVDDAQNTLTCCG